MLLFVTFITIHTSVLLSAYYYKENLLHSSVIMKYKKVHLHVRVVGSVVTLKFNDNDWLLLTFLMLLFVAFITIHTSVLLSAYYYKENLLHSSVIMKYKKVHLHVRVVGSANRISKILQSVIK